MSHQKLIGFFIAFVLVFLFSGSPLLAQPSGFTVGGVITYYKFGVIYVKLLNQAQFERDIDGKDALSSFVIKLDVDPHNTGKKYAEFQFQNVPPGVYALSCFQDTNGNGKLDLGPFGPVEPWGMYRVKPLFKPVFKNEAFEVNSDVTPISIEVK